MPANHHIDNKHKLIITTWDGEASDIEFIEAIKRYQNDIQNHHDYIHYDEVVNLSNATGLKFTTEGIKNIGEIASKTDKEEVERKLAVVVSSNLTFGLVRMYVVYRSFVKKAHKEIRIFKNENDAFEWVKE